MYNIRKLGNLEELVVALNGGIVGSQPLAGSIGGVVGNTLTFSTPSGTVTFSDTNSTGLLSPAQIVAQIKAQVAGISASLHGGRLAMWETTPTTGLALDASTEAVKAILGLVPSLSGVVASNPAIYEVLGAFALLDEDSPTSASALMASIEALLTAPTRHEDLTPHDTNAQVATVGLMIGVGGTLVYRAANSVADVDTTVVAGQFVPGDIILVKSTGTSASRIVAVSY